MKRLKIFKRFLKKNYIQIIFIGIWSVILLSFLFTNDSKREKRENAVKEMKTDVGEVFLKGSGSDNDIVSEKEEVFPFTPYKENSSIEEPIISAKSAAILDIESETYLFKKNIDERLPVASLNKLMTTLLVSKYGYFDDTLTYSPYAINTFGNSGKEYINESLKVRDVVDLALMASSNDAAVALAEYVMSLLPPSSKKELGITDGNSYQESSRRIDVFVDFMNKEKEFLNMKNTQFVDPHGLNETGFSCSRGLVNLFLAFIQEKELLNSISTGSKSIKAINNPAYIHNIKNSNVLLGTEEGVIGGKTGTNFKAKENLILLWKNKSGLEQVIVIINSDDRYADAKNLINWLNEAFVWTNDKE